jgi:nucleoside triphosphate pyrophosphatase
MRTFSDAYIEDYLAATGAEVCSTVGAYRLEGLGAQLFTRVEGDFFTILGLPLLPLLDFLRGHGIVAE